MNKVTIIIELENSAFDEPGPELEAILRKLANRAAAGRLDDSSILDSNGNKVGTVEVS